MKSLAFALLALFALIAVTPDANAVVCARGVYRADVLARVVPSSSDTLTTITIIAE
jgi:hypothetical protein